jgi:predicted RNA-binding protein
MVKYWIGVASEEHVNRGIREGICQLCHGKKQPLNRMKQGDYIIYYSSKVKMDEPLLSQKFTAIGQIVDTGAYEIGNGVYRRNVKFKPARAVPIKPLIEKLSFIKDKVRWGYPFLFGHFEISEGDFNIIAEAMLINDKADKC